MRGPLGVAAGVLLSATLAGCGWFRSGPEHPVTLAPALENQTMTLANGLKVILHPDRSASSVYVQVRYYVGSKDDPPGHFGLAHLYEHLMFRGSPHTRAKEFGAWVHEVGGKYNSATGLDTTDYFETMPPRELPRALWLESDRMAYRLRAVDGGSFAKERDVVINESRERYQNVPYGDISRVAEEALFGQAHPYGHRTIGRIADLKRTTLADARAFGATYYRANNATLVVCGAFDPAVARRWIAAYFAKIPPGRAAPSRRFEAPLLTADRRVDVRSRVEAPLLLMAWHAPPPDAEGYRELGFALDLVRAFATKRLVKKEKLAERVSARLCGGRLGGMAFITAKLTLGADFEDAIAAIDGAVDDLLRLGRYVELGDWKSQELVARVARLESLGARAHTLLHGLDYHDEPDSARVDLHRIDQLDNDDVTRAAEQFLKEAHRVVVMVTPDATLGGDARR